MAGPLIKAYDLHMALPAAKISPVFQRMTFRLLRTAIA